MNPLVPLRCDIMGRYSVSCVFRESSALEGVRYFYEVYLWTIDEKSGCLTKLFDQRYGGRIFPEALAAFNSLVSDLIVEMGAEIGKSEHERIEAWETQKIPPFGSEGTESE